MDSNFAIDDAYQVIMRAAMEFKYEGAELLMEANMARMASGIEEKEDQFYDWPEFASLDDYNEDYLFKAAVRLYNSHKEYIDLHMQLDSMGVECSRYSPSYNPLRTNVCINFADYLMGSSGYMNSISGTSSLQRHFKNTGALADELLKTKTSLWLAGFIESAGRFVEDVFA